MPATTLILVSRCPECGHRSGDHPIVGETDSGGLVRECECGGFYDSGILRGPEIPPFRNDAERNRYHALTGRT